MKNKLLWLRQRSGYRGLFLLLLGLTDILVGAYLVTLGSSPAQGMLVVDENIWGWLWAGTGFFLLTGVLARSDRWHFAVAALLKTAWSAEFIRLAAHKHSGAVIDVTAGRLWYIAAAWVTAALIVVLAASWPEHRK